MTPMVGLEGPQVTHGMAPCCLLEAATFLPPEGGGCRLRAPGSSPNKGRLPGAEGPSRRLACPSSRLLCPARVPRDQHVICVGR